ncbi:MAG TPA: divergent polysaccharide deacetylase family protein [Candidatus Elarobacter sp.]|jgi:hypothetical protein
MKRRRARRRSRRSAFPLVALLLASAVVAVAVTLIVRGDTSSRGVHGTTAHHRARDVATAEPSLPPAASAVTAAPAPASESAPPLAEPSEAPEATTPAPGTTAAPSATPRAGAPRLAIIIDDCGQWPDTEHGFIALPAALTMSVLPHVRYGTQIAHDADAAGKGVMLHLPMEPLSGADPGPGRITVAMTDDAIAAQVRDDLASVPLAAGVNNHEGSRATADDRVMRAVAAVLAERHLFFIDSRTGSASVAERDASAAGIPTAGRDVFLDNVADVAATRAQIRRAAQLAKANGSAIAIGHPRPTTLVAVRALIPELERDGIQLVLARDLVR